MKRKTLLFLVLLFLSILLLAVAFASPPAAVTNLKAKGGVNYVALSWDPSPQAQGYIIYRKQGNENFTYLYMVSKTSYSDFKASPQVYNFYRVYPYKMFDGVRLVGPSKTYVYGNPSVWLPPVTNVKAQSQQGQVKLSWKGLPQADGYILYRKVGKSGRFSYLYITSEETYIDKKASKTEFSFYRVYPYMLIKGKRVIGPSDAYVYGRANFPAN